MKISLSLKDKKEIIDDLIDTQYLTCLDNKLNKSGNYDYLLKISVDNFTEEEIARLISLFLKLKMNIIS